jgi:hypothetical protein
MRRKVRQERVYVTFFVIITASVDPESAAFNKNGSFLACYQTACYLRKGVKNAIT